MKSTRGRIADPDRDEYLAAREEKIWNTISEDLYHVQSQSPGLSRDQALRELIEKVSEALNDELRKVEKEFKAVDRTAFWYDADCLEEMKHQFRRSIAGYQQVVDLLEQGLEPFRTAMLDGVLILEGHRFVVKIIFNHALTQILSSGRSVSIGASFASSMDGEVGHMP